MYLTLLALSVVFVVLYRKGGSLTILNALILLPLISYLSARFSVRSLAVFQRIDSTVLTRGDRAGFFVRIVNKSFWLHPSVKIVYHQESLSLLEDVMTDRFQVLPFEEIEVRSSLAAKHRGLYRVGAKHVEVWDFLGLFSFSAAVPEQLEVCIYPRVHQIVEMPLNPVFMLKEQARKDVLDEDYSSVLDVRRYEHGDSMRKIHWKLSARKNELLTKNFHNSTMNNTCLFMNTVFGSKRRESLDLADAVAEAAVSVSRFCIENQMPVNFNYYSNNEICMAAANNTAEFDHIRYVCASVQFVENINFAEIVEFGINSQTEKTNLILFTANCSPRLLQTVKNAQQSGHRVVLVAFESEEVNAVVWKDKTQELAEAGVSCYLFESGQPIGEVFKCL